MANTPLQPRQTAWGRACVVDTESNITRKRVNAKHVWPATRRGVSQPQYGDDQAAAGIRLP